MQASLNSSFLFYHKVSITLRLHRCGCSGSKFAFWATSPSPWRTDACLYLMLPSSIHYYILHHRLSQPVLHPPERIPCSLACDAEDIREFNSSKLGQFNQQQKSDTFLVTLLLEGTDSLFIVYSSSTGEEIIHI